MSRERTPGADTGEKSDAGDFGDGHDDYLVERHLHQLCVNHPVAQTRDASVPNDDHPGGCSFVFELSDEDARLSGGIEATYFGLRPSLCATDDYSPVFRREP